MSRSPPTSFQLQSNESFAAAAAEAMSRTSSDAAGSPGPVSLIDFSTFVNAYRKEKGSADPITNTRIGKQERGIYGGSFSIPETDYAGFLNKYSAEILDKGKTEYMTEFQLLNNGPCLVDLDFRFPYETTERQYSKDHLDDLVGAYLEELTSMFQFDAMTSFNIYVMEKPTLRRDDEKQVVKDGIHLILGINCERKMQIVLRKRMIRRVQEMWSDLPLLNSWEEVFDEGITNGSVGWQLYGSAKPDCAAYALTHIYMVGYDEMDRQPTVNCRSATDPDWRPVWRDLLPLLSARCRTHPKLFYRSDFAKELDRVQLPPSLVAGGGIRLGDGALPTPAVMCPFTAAVLHVRTADELENTVTECLHQCRDSGKEADWNLVEIFEYTMGLPEAYYGAGSYDKWIRVGLALKSVSADAFFVWVAFSAQSDTFDWNIRALYEKWESFASRENGLSVRSIMYWCRADAPEKYREIRFRCADMVLDRVMGSYEDIDEDAKTIDRKGTTDCDLAQVLHNLFRDMYKCVSITNNIWYKYQEPRWIQIDAGVNLRKSISGELRALYMKKANQFMHLRENLTADDDPRKQKKITKYCDKLLSVCSRLGSTNDKKNIMTEAKELFWDPHFVKKLDANPYLLCFNNGVVDFKTRQFRRGTPEDYLTKCTNMDYVHYDLTQPNPIVDQLRDFMHKLFPTQEIHDYMWEHLAATLIGVLPNQTWNIYTGDGQNGKSMLVKLMEYVLGEYKGELPVGLLTQDRGKLGGAMPEIVALKGLRYAVAPEAKKGDCINDAVVKQLTSGIDAIQARGLYKAEMEIFYPQFELVLCTNYLMQVKSNDHGTWRRIRVVPFKALFTDNPVDDDPDKPYQFLIDRSLEERLSGWAQVFASMLVDIAFETQGKVRDCNEVLEASNAYRQSQDTIAEFVHECLVVDNLPQSRTMPSVLQMQFKSWHENNYDRRDRPKNKELVAYMDRRFKNKVGKDWVGVRVNFEMSTGASASMDVVDDCDVADVHHL